MWLLIHAIISVKPCWYERTPPSSPWIMAVRSIVCILVRLTYASYEIWPLSHRRVLAWLHHARVDKTGDIYVVPGSLVNSSPSGQNGRRFSRRHFQMYFLEWKCMKFYKNFTKVRSYVSNLQHPGIGSDNGLVSARWQANVWTNAG